VQVDSSSAALGGAVLSGLLVFLLWGVAHEWWTNRRRRRAWSRQDDSISVAPRGRDEDDPDPGDDPGW